MKREYWLFIWVFIGTASGGIIGTIGYNRGLQSPDPYLDTPKGPEAPLRQTSGQTEAFPRVSQKGLTEIVGPTAEQLRQRVEALEKEVKRLLVLTTETEKINARTVSEIEYGLDNAEWTNESYRRQMAVERILKKELGYTIDQFGGFNKIE